jgi:hypothetical protein
MIKAAFGLVDCSPIEASEMLKSFRLSHSVVGGFIKTMAVTTDYLSPEQPAWPVVIDKVKTITKIKTRKSPLIYFVCDARTVLAQSNISQALWPERRTKSLEESIQDALVDALSAEKPWTLTVNEPSLSDYVLIASKPAFLNLIQGSIYRITPYQKRKEVQKLCIQYLAGMVPLLKVKTLLKSSLKFNDLLSMMDSDKALNLREAIKATNSKPLEQVCKEYGVEQFEIMYVIKSASQNSA